MDKLKVNCLVCGEPLGYWEHEGEPLYACDTKTCINYSISHDLENATALAAMQQRLAELEGLAEAAAMLDVMDILTGHGKAFRRRHNAMTAVIRKLADQRRDGPK